MAPALSAWIIVSHSRESLIGFPMEVSQQAAIAQPDLGIEHTNRPCPHVRESQTRFRHPNSRDPDKYSRDPKMRCQSPDSTSPPNEHSPRPRSHPKARPRTQAHQPLLGCPVVNLNCLFQHHYAFYKFYARKPINPSWDAQW